MAASSRPLSCQAEETMSCPILSFSCWSSSLGRLQAVCFPRAGLLAVVLLCLGACAFDDPGALPPGPALPPPSALEDIRMGLLVTPFEGLPADQADVIQTLLIRALHDRDVAAAAINPAPGSHLLRGRLIRGADGQPQIAAELVNPDGSVAASARVDAARLEEPTGRTAVALHLAAVLVDGTTAQAESGTRQDEAAAAAAKARTHWQLVVPEVTGAPGDGSRSLSEATRRALELAGFTIIAPGKKPDKKAVKTTLTVAGSVTLSEPRGPVQSITLSWQVRGADGSEKGRIDQANDIPTGSLDGAWGPVASAAGAAAAEGLADLIGRLPTSPAP